jgi:hypothetical protein
MAQYKGAPKFEKDHRADQEAHSRIHVLAYRTLDLPESSSTYSSPLCEPQRVRHPSAL